MDKARIIELHQAGLSERRIVKEIGGVSKTSVHRVIEEYRRQQAPEPAPAEIPPAAAVEAEAGRVSTKISIEGEKPQDLNRSEPPAEILTPASRFRRLLALYRLSEVDCERILAYADSFNQEKVYEDPASLKKVLADQGVKLGTAAVIVRHWCNQEGLTAPPAPEVSGGSREHAGERFIVLGGRPIRADDGNPDALTWSQALQLIDVGNHQGNQSSPELQALRDELRRAQDEISRLRDTRIESLEATIARLQEHPPGGKTEIDIMELGINKAAAGLSELRGTVEEILRPAAKPLDPEARRRIGQAIGDEAARVIGKHELGEQIFGRGSRQTAAEPGKPEPTPVPAPARHEEQPSENPISGNSQSGYRQGDENFGATHMAEIFRRYQGGNNVLQAGGWR